MTELSLAAIGALVVLALIDSTSFGTLLIPIWLLLAPGAVRPARVLTFLGTVAAGYLLLGVALYSGLAVVAEPLSDVVTSRPVLWLQVAVGAGLFLWSFPLEKREPKQPGRLLAWRDRAVGDDASTRGLVTLAVVAVALEAAMMLPYLAAIGIITAMDLAWPAGVGLIAAYAAVMVLPALALLIGRLVAASTVEPLLRSIEAWMAKSAQSTLAWTVGIVGFLLAANAASSLGLL